MKERTTLQEVLAIRETTATEVEHAFQDHPRGPDETEPRYRARIGSMVYQDYVTRVEGETPIPGTEMQSSARPF